jgi:hypothetical protein
VAGKSTLNRLELSRPQHSRYHGISHDPAAIGTLLVACSLARTPPPEGVVLDLVLICAQRRIGLANTRLARAAGATIRLELFKIGALISIPVRRIKLAMNSACPFQPEWPLIYARHAASARAAFHPFPSTART